MYDEHLTALAERIAACLCGDHERLCLTLIRRLADGQPVSPARLATDLELDEQAVVAALRHIHDLEYDASANIVAFGISLLPTAHQFRLNGHILYTWCALDTFLYTALLGQPTQVVSRCPITTLPVALTITPEGITRLDPPSSAISLVIPVGSAADCRRSSFCNYGHFFATAEAGARWQRNHPVSVILPVAMAHRLGQLLAERRMLRAGY